MAYASSDDGYVWKTVDGGRTWDESRLIVEARPFYGDAGQRVYFGVHRRDAAAWSTRHQTAERVQPERGLPPFYRGMVSRGRRYGGNGLSGNLTRPMPRGILSMRPSRVSAAGIGHTSEGRVSAAQNVNFGIGLPGRAPRLQNTVRKFNVRPPILGTIPGASGLNIKQTLWLRGYRPTEVRIVVTHPQDPNILFACTFFGLFKSYDGGLNWVRTFVGINPLGRQTHHLAIDPVDNDRVLLATANGMYASADGGENFIKATSQGVGEGSINWIQFDTRQPRYVFAGTDYGLLRSADHGETWNWIYLTTFPTGRIVRSVVIDPADQHTGYVGTHDGAYVTDNIHQASLEDWRRLGGLQFTGHEVHRIIACSRHRGHLWAVSNVRLPRPGTPGLSDTGGAYLWESRDGGDEWQILYSGETTGAMRWIDNHPDQPDLLWIAWSRAMSRIRRATRRQRVDVAAKQRIEHALSTLPPLGEVLIAALRFTGLEPHRRLGYRQRAHFRALVPRIDLSYRHFRRRDLPLFHDGLYPLPFRFRQRADAEFRDFRAMLQWDLSDWVFTLQSTLFGRVERLTHEMVAYLYSSIHRSYGELRRLQVLMASPPKDLRVRLMYGLRREELQSYVDLLTGGYLTRYRRGDRPSGWSTPWFERWPGVSPDWFPQTSPRR